MSSYWVKYKARNYQSPYDYDESMFIHDITPEELEDWCIQKGSFSNNQKDYVITEIINIVKL